MPSLQLYDHLLRFQFFQGLSRSELLQMAGNTKFGFLKEQEGRLVAGMRQTQRLIAAGRASRVLIARDADERMRRELRALAEAAGVPAEECESMELLGKRCRIAVPCAAAAEEKQG